MPLGSLVAGTIAEQLGEPTAVLLSASVLGLFALLVQVGFPRLRSLA